MSDRMRWLGQCDAKGCFIEQRWRLTELDGTLPHGANFGDLDAWAEIDGRFLFIEHKPEGFSWKQGDGQWLALKRLNALPGVTVWWMRDCGDGLRDCRTRRAAGGNQQGRTAGQGKGVGLWRWTRHPRRSGYACWPRGGQVTHARAAASPCSTRRPGAVMGETWAASWASQWAAGAQRFNTNHLPPGTGGGQFASAGGTGGSSAGKGSGSTAAKPPPTAHQKHVAHIAHLANDPTARKADLRSRAKAARARAHVMQGQLDALLKQEAVAAAVAKKAAVAAKQAAAAAKHPGGAAAAATAAAAVKHHAAVKHKAHRKAAAHHATLKSRISTLRTQISGVLAQASALDAQAAKL